MTPRRLSIVSHVSTIAAVGLVLLLLVPALGPTTPGTREAPAPAKAPTVVADAAQFDWPELHRSPSLSGFTTNTTLSTANASELGVRWATSLYGAALDSPVVAFDPTLNLTLVYIGTENGDVVGINVATGQIVWGDWLGSAIRSTPVVSNGTVYVATFTTPALYALNASTGAVECSVIAPQTIEGTPTVATPPGGVRTVYLPTQGSAKSGPFMAINANNCSVEWEFIGYHTPGTGSWDSASFALNATGVPIVLFGSDNPDSSVYALNALTGAELWRYQTYNPGQADNDVAAGATISAPGVNGFADGVAYVDNKDGIMYALNLTSGHLYWKTAFNNLSGVSGVSRSTASLDGTTLVFGFHAGFYALNALTGATLWDYKDPSGSEIISSPAVAGTGSTAIVVAGDIAGSVDVASLAGGTALYRYQTGGYITASPAVSNGNILIASSDGFLYDFSVGGGNALTLPTTAETYPADSASLPNPNGMLTVDGSAHATAGVAAVVVAIQTDGPIGPWWDAMTGSWAPGPIGNPAVLASPGAASTAWSLSYPVPAAGGTYQATAYAVSSLGQSDISGVQVGYSVRFSTTGPNVEVSSPFVPPGSTVTLTGSGYGDSERVAVDLGGVPVTNVTSSSTGKLPSTKIHVASTARFGLTSVVARGQSSGRSASAALTVSNSWDELGDGPLQENYEANDTVLNYLVSFHRIWVHLAWHFDAGSPLNASPVVADGVVYLGDGTGQVYALDLHNGGLIWMWNGTAPAGAVGSLAVDPTHQLVLLSEHSGTVAALNSSSGALVWSRGVGGTLSAPIVSGKVVYVDSTSGTVTAINEASGTVAWSAVLGSGVTSAPAVDSARGLVIVGEENGVVACLRAGNGSLDWQFSTGGPVTSSASIAGGSVFFGSGDHSVYAISELTGTKQWSLVTGGAVTGGGAYTTHGTGGGAEFVIGSADGKVYFIHAASGSVAYTIAYGSPIVGLAALDGTVIVETKSGLVSGDRTFAARNDWDYKTEAVLTVAPIVVDSAIYVASGNGNLYAFTSFGQAPD